MTSTKKLNTINSPNFANFGEPKVIKRYDDTPPENVAKEMGVPVESLTESRSAISFAKYDSSGLSFAVPDDQVGQTDTANQPPKDAEPSAADKRNDRRTEWKQAADVQRRAMQMQKEAEEKLKKVKQVEDLLEQAKKDPTAVAKALNMDPNEFLKQYQNKMFDIPNEIQPKPEDEIQARLQKYEDERKAEREQFQTLQSQTIKQNYVSNKILPVIMNDKDKFEILNNDDPNLAASLIYDLMNQHYMATGEEWNPADAAEELENQLAKELEDRIGQVRKYKKFSKHFSNEPTQLGEEQEESHVPEVRHSTQPNQQLGGSDINTTTDVKTSQFAPIRKKTGYIPSTNEAPANTAQRDGRWISKRESRLESWSKRQGQ